VCVCVCAGAREGRDCSHGTHRPDPSGLICVSFVFLLWFFCGSFVVLALALVGSSIMVLIDESHESHMQGMCEAIENEMLNTVDQKVT
jgi:hypothetical protein